MLRGTDWPISATTRAGAMLALVVVLFTPMRSFAGAALEVEARGACVDAPAVRARLAPLLAPYATARGGLVSVVAQKASDGTAVTLRVVSVAGDVVLERRLVLRPEDCHSGPELLATILERFLREVPRGSWADPPPRPPPVLPPLTLPAPPPPPPPTGREPSVAVVARAAFAGRMPGPTGSLDLGVALEAGTPRRRLFGSLTGRLGSPGELGGGHYVDGMVALGIGWRALYSSFTTALELRLGARMARGYGFTTERTAWLPMAELAGGISWYLGDLLVGPTVAVAPFEQAATSTSGARARLPYLQVGLGIEWPLRVDLL